MNEELWCGPVATGFCHCQYTTYNFIILICFIWYTYIFVNSAKNYKTHAPWSIFPQTDLLPNPNLWSTSPPWIMKLGIMQLKIIFLYLNLSTPLVGSQKFSAAIGAVSLQRKKTSWPNSMGCMTGGFYCQHIKLTPNNTTKIIFKNKNKKIGWCTYTIDIVSCPPLWFISQLSFDGGMQCPSNKIDNSVASSNLLGLR